RHMRPCPTRRSSELWPIHRELDQLGARAPGGRGGVGGRIVAFGSHQGRLPDALSPSPDYAGGPLRLVPLSLAGDAAIARLVGERSEEHTSELQSREN